MQTTDVLSRNPGLANLLNDLNERFLTPTGTSRNIDQDLQQAKYSLQHKKEYLKTLTVYEPIDRLRFLAEDGDGLHSSSLHGRSNAIAEGGLQRQISLHVDRIISLLETRRLYIDNNSMPLASLSSATAVPQSASPSQGLAATDPSGTSFSSPPTEPLLSFFLEEGSSEEDVDTFTLMQLQPHIEALEGFAPLMTRVIQHSIHERSQLVLMFLRRHIASSGATGDRNLYASRNNLLTTPASDRDSQKSSTRVIQELNDAIDQIKAKVMALEMSKQESALVDKNVLQRVHELVEILQKSMDVLWELLVEFKLKYQKQQDQVFVDGYSQLVESVVQKLQIKKLELRKTVYDPDTILKLSVIRDQLDALEQQLQRQASENSELVEQYRSAGKDFNDIVQAYTEVKERIETVQDDIRRLF